MARIDTFDNFATDVANSIRKMTGKTGKIKASQFDTEIESIQTGGAEPVLQTKSVLITENGDQKITPDEGYDGLSEVNISANVQDSSGTETKVVELTNYVNGRPTTMIIDTAYLSENYLRNCNTYTTYGFLSDVDNIVFKRSEIHGFGNYSFANSFIKNITFPVLANTRGFNTAGQGFGTYLCQNCTRLTSVKFLSEGHFWASNSSSGRTSGYHFAGCTSLQTVELPEFENTNYSLRSIFGYMFNGCSQLASINLQEGLETIDGYAFTNCTNLALTSLPNSITIIDIYAFSGCSKLALTQLPNNLITLGSTAFRNCTSIENLTLPNTLTTIGPDCFYGCTKLVITKIPDGVTSLATRSFYNCGAIPKLSMLNVTTIYNGTNSSNAPFYGCAGMKQIWIGSAITNSGLSRYALYGCNNLVKMYIDLPRATVEGFTNYQYAFMNNTAKVDVIVCNDDEDFVAKEAFDVMEVI